MWVQAGLDESFILVRRGELTRHKPRQVWQTSPPAARVPLRCRWLCWTLLVVDCSQSPGCLRVSAEDDVDVKVLSLR